MADITCPYCEDSFPEDIYDRHVPCPEEKGDPVGRKEVPDLLAGLRRDVVARGLRLAHLQGTRGLSLRSLSREDLRRLQLIFQHVERELTSARQKAHQPWRR